MGMAQDYGHIRGGGFAPAIDSAVPAGYCGEKVEVAPSHIINDSACKQKALEGETHELESGLEEKTEDMLYVTIPLALVRREKADTEAPPTTRLIRDVEELIAKEEEDILTPGRIASPLEDAWEDEDQQHISSKVTHRVACLGGVTQEMEESSFVELKGEISGIRGAKPIKANIFVTTPLMGHEWRSSRRRGSLQSLQRQPR